MKKLLVVLGLLLAFSLNAQSPARHNNGVVLGDPIGTSGDPTGTKEGQIYWNDTLGKFRQYNGTVWSDLSATGANPTLQQVTDVGSLTDDNMSIENNTARFFQVSNVGNTIGTTLNTTGIMSVYDAGATIELNAPNDRITFKDIGTGFDLQLAFPSIAGSTKTATFQDVTGTVALTSDVLANQTIANTADSSTHTTTLSDSGGSTKFAEGANITLTTTGTGLDGVVTIAATSGGNITKVGIPANNQVGVWTGDGTLEGNVNFVFDSATRILKIGLEGSNHGTVHLKGTGTGFNNGGAIQLDLADDYDTSIAYYEVKASSDDFIIDSDVKNLLLYDGGLDKWISSVNFDVTGTLDATTLSIGATAITSTAAELNLLDLSGLTAGDVLSADTGTTASWKANTISVLEIINEGNGDGVIMKGRVAANYGNIGLNAVDFSDSDSASAIRGATGDDSFATGDKSISGGDRSFAGGFQSNAGGLNAIAFGWNAIASGDQSAAFGAGVASGNNSFSSGANGEASGTYSASIGRGGKAIGVGSIAMGYAEATGQYSLAGGFTTYAESYAETTFGTYNTDYTANSTTAIDANDRTFLVGNGTAPGSRADAFTILKGGEVGIGIDNFEANHNGALLEVNGEVELNKGITNDVTTAYELVIGDEFGIVTMNNGSANTLTIPANSSVAFPIGTEIVIINIGAGTTTVAITTDTLNQNVGGLTMAQYDKRTLIKITATSWILGN